MTTEQEHLLDLLKTFSSICEEHGLQYWLVGGTLLGAVRHQGFIPWDDDIDVAMPEKDYQRFLALKDSLPEWLVLLEEDSSQNYPFHFCELCDTRVVFETGNTSGPAGIYIDIFPLVPSVPPGRMAKFLFNIISVVGYVLQVKTGWTTYTPYKKICARVGFAIMHSFSIQHLKKIRRVLMKWLTEKESIYWFSPGGGHKGLVEFYPQSWFAENEELLFEGTLHPVPIGWDGYLTQLYGNYMILPDISDQKSIHKKVNRENIGEHYVGKNSTRSI